MVLDREELLQFLPMSKEAIDEFSPEIIPENYRMTFKIKPLDMGGKRLLNVFQTKIRRDATLALSNPDRDANFEAMEEENEKILDLVRKYIVGWSNFKDVDGNDFIFETDNDGYLSLECFKSLPAVLQVEVIERLTKISGLTAREEISLKS